MADDDADGGGGGSGADDRSGKEVGRRFRIASGRYWDVMPYVLHKGA